MPRRKQTAEDREWRDSHKQYESQPTVADEDAAKREWNLKNPDAPWDTLKSRKKNSLIQDQKFHREFRGLSNAIKNFR